MAVAQAVAVLHGWMAAKPGRRYRRICGLFMYLRNRMWLVLMSLPGSVSVRSFGR